MSTAAGAPSNGANPGVRSPESTNKGKGKSAVASPDVSMEEDEDEDEEGEDDDEEEEDEMEVEMDDDEDEEEDALDEIDTSHIVSGRRTRGIRVDYSSKEAHEKAGLDPEGHDDESSTGKAHP